MEKLSTYHSLLADVNEVNEKADGVDTPLCVASWVP